MSSRPFAMLYRFDLHVVPILAKRAVDAPVKEHLAIEVVETFPDTDGGKVGGPLRRDLPLIRTIVGNTAQADLSIGPRLDAGPVDAGCVVLNLLRRPNFEITRRSASTAAVDANADVTMRYPFFRIRHFPALICICRSGKDIRVLRSHLFPCCGVPIRKMQHLRV